MKKYVALTDQIQKSEKYISCKIASPLTGHTVGAIKVYYSAPSRPYITFRHEQTKRSIATTWRKIYSICERSHIVHDAVYDCDI